MKSQHRIGVGVVGIQHQHIERMVEAVQNGGGTLTQFYSDEPEAMAEFGKLYPNARPARSEAEVLENPEIALVVSAIIPSERAQLGMRVMQAGKDYMADKGGFLTLADLAEARRVQQETGRIYSVSYNETLLIPSVVRAKELVDVGAIGRVVQMIGIAPHGLYGHGPRPDWFWTRAARGGILADIGTHQCSDFLTFTGTTRATVVAASVTNHNSPQHSEFEDFGEMLLRGDNGAVGYARVDFFEGRSLGFRLILLGTDGSMEVHKHEQRITLTTRTEKRVIEVENFVCPYGPRLVDDVLNRTETAMPQEQTFLASELAVRAQNLAQVAASGAA